MSEKTSARLKDVLNREINNVARELNIDHYQATGKLCKAIIDRGVYALK